MSLNLIDITDTYLITVIKDARRLAKKANWHRAINLFKNANDLEKSLTLDISERRKYLIDLGFKIKEK